jgi:hypothetical protein
MTFTSRYDSDGTGKFMVGDIARVVIMNEIDYHAVSQLLNEAYRLGRKASAQDLLALAHELARRAGV